MVFLPLISAFLMGFSFPASCAGSLGFEIVKSPGMVPLGRSSELVLELTWPDTGQGLLPVLSPFETTNIRVIDGDITSRVGGPSCSLTITYILSGIEVGPAEIGPFIAVLVDSSGTKADSVFTPAVELEIEEPRENQSIYIIVPVLVLAIVFAATLLLRRRKAPVEQRDTGDHDELSRIESMCTPERAEGFLVAAEGFARRLVSRHLEIDASKLTPREIAEALSRKGFGKKEISATESLLIKLQDMRFSKTESSPEKLGEVLVELKHLAGLFEE